MINFAGTEYDNLVIGWGSDSNGLCCPLISGDIPDLHFAGGMATQCFPLFIYEPCDELQGVQQDLLEQTA